MSGRQLQFSHITKTAGSSIERLAKLHGVEWGAENKHFWSVVSSVAKYENQSGDPWHLPLSFVDDKKLSDLIRREDFFCVVRNPYERVVSEYYCRWGSQYVVDLRLINSDSLTVFNQSICAGLNRLKKLRQNGLALHLGHWQEQRLYVQKNEEWLIPQENVLHFEELQDSLTPLFVRYGLQFCTALPRERTDAFPKRFGVTHLSQESIELVNDLYEADFILFGYKMMIRPSAKKAGC